MKQWFNRGLALLSLGGLLAAPAFANYPEYQDLQAADSNPSPQHSQIDDYRNQPEVMNLLPSDGLVKVLRTNQKNLVNDYVTKVIPVYNAPVRELVHAVRRMCQIEGGNAETIYNDATKEQAIQVEAPAYLIPYLEVAIKNLDVSWLKEYWDGASDIYLKLQHRRASFVDMIADNYGGTEGFTNVDTTNNALHRFDESYREDQYTQAVKIVDIPPNEVELSVKVYEVTASNDLKLGTDYIAWKNGPGRNLFAFATAGYKDFQRARGYTSVYDPFINGDVQIPIGQDRKVADFNGRESASAFDYLLTSNYVDFLQSKGEARVIDEQKLLIESSHRGKISNLDQVAAITNNLNDLDTVEPNITPEIIGRENVGDLPFGNTGDTEIDTATAPKITPASFVTFIDANGNGKLDPGEIVLERNEDGTFTWFVDANGNGILDPGEKILNSSAEEGENSSGGSAVTPDFGRTLDYENVGQVGMSLRLTPYVGLESMELHIDLELGDLNGTAPSGIPIINTRTVKSTVRLLDGEPFVLAGLTRRHDIKDTEKAPWLGSIPIVGYLFGGETDVKRNNDVVIVITPKFHLANEVNLATPPRVKTLDLLINNSCCPQQGIPGLRFGYDQWLLDKG